MDCETRIGGLTRHKVGYSSRNRAAAAMAKVTRKRAWDKGAFNVYKCPRCRKWHFGHVIGANRGQV
jgi:hypothetical protein